MLEGRNSLHKGEIEDRDSASNLRERNMGRLRDGKQRQRRKKR